MRFGLLAVLSGCTMEVGVGHNPGPPGHNPLDPTDRDKDGFSVDDGDCDDTNAGIDPTAIDDCDGIDNDCSGVPDVTHDGLDACAAQDRFVQTLELDVLFVIDASVTMEPYLERVATGAEDFLKPLVGPAFDTHIGVITMDAHDAETAGRLLTFEGRRFVEGDVATLEDAMQWLRGVLTDHEPVTTLAEARAAVAAGFLGAVESNPGFLRDDAALHVVFVSNREDASQDPSLNEFLTAMEDLKGLSRPTMHAIVQLDDLDCEGNENPAGYGGSFEQLVVKTLGTKLSVCRDDYGPFLSALGQVAATDGLGTRFELALPADPQSVKVTLLPKGGEPEVLADDDFSLTVDCRTVVLDADEPPAAGTTIIVDYREDPTK